MRKDLIKSLLPNAAISGDPHPRGSLHRCFVVCNFLRFKMKCSYQAITGANN